MVQKAAKLLSKCILRWAVLTVSVAGAVFLLCPSAHAQYNLAAFWKAPPLPPQPPDSWVNSMPATAALSERYYHTAVWSGSEMIVWGGQVAGSYNDGGRYNPTTNSWALTTTNNAPAGRTGHTAVWAST